jgi:hypothetical protein
MIVMNVNYDYCYYYILMVIMYVNMDVVVFVIVYVLLVILLFVGIVRIFRVRYFAYFWNIENILLFKLYTYIISTVSRLYLIIIIVN